MNLWDELTSSFLMPENFFLSLSGEILKNKFKRLISIYYHTRKTEKVFNVWCGAAAAVANPFATIHNSVSFEEHGNFTKNSALRFHILSRRRSAISRIFYQHQRVLKGLVKDLIKLLTASRRDRVLSHCRRRLCHCRHDSVESREK